MEFGNEIQKIFANSESNENPGDYWKDGILYCCKCNTAKTWKGTILGNPVTSYCLCKCETEKRAVEEKERKQREYKAYIDSKKYYAYGGKNPMWDWTFDKDDGKSPLFMKRIKKYAENYQRFLEQGKGLLLYGNVGTGKTFAACCVANRIIEKGYTVKFTSISQIANQLYDKENKSEFMKELVTCPLLVIDDLGVERNTAFMNEIVYNVIDGRYRSGKPVIVTTNLTAKGLREPDSIDKERIYSRLKEICIPFEVAGEDRRISKAKNQFKTDLEFLDS